MLNIKFGQNTSNLHVKLLNIYGDAMQLCQATIILISNVADINNQLLSSDYRVITITQLLSKLTIYISSKDSTCTYAGMEPEN